jgi:DNA mismatch repair protein MutL
LRNDVLCNGEAGTALKTGRIRVLAPEEARKIAAGEVVDRPAALVREFLDNAIDAGSSRIEVLVEGGGITRIEVIDDGGGMGREDLELCWQTHATSKIRSVEDLNTAETLGFRGEALAAAAAVSRLEILSCADNGEAWLLEVGPGPQTGPRLTRSSRSQGTSVRALGIFDSIPARKRFLKREGAEGALCRQALIDKALAFPGISFRFSQNGGFSLFLPAAASLKERFAAALLPRTEGTFLHELGFQGPGFSGVAVVGGPELIRRDRRQQFVFANGRRINDFSLLQALEYGVQGWFPNGTHPVGAVYIDIDPALADFNIHPAKREARFRDPGVIHHGLTSALRDFTRRSGMTGGRKYPEFADGDARAQGGASLFGKPDHSLLAMEALLERPPAFAPLPGRGTEPIQHGHNEGGVSERSPHYGEKLRFAGRLFGVFILVEEGERLLIIDQHAAHERILYDRFLREDIPLQELLVPIPFSTESGEEDRFLESRRADLEKLGVRIAGDFGAWRIEALPVNWRLPDAETVREILNLRQAGENIAEHWAATLCCHNAVKEGDYLDEGAALALAEEALNLPIPRCPHGRPIWIEMRREELFRAVKRL